MDKKDINNLDTSEMLTEQDYKDLNDLSDIKRTIISTINTHNLVDYIRELIDNSPFIDFKNERARKFVDPKHPIFRLTIDFEAARLSKKYNLTKLKFNSKEEEVKYFSNILFYEIITHVTLYMSQCLHQNPEVEDYIASKDLFRDLNLEDRKNMLHHNGFLTTMFAMQFGQDDSTNVLLEMLI